MRNGIVALEKQPLNVTVVDANYIKQLLENYQISNSLEDEILDFFKEVAALKRQSLDDTLLEINTGTQKYIEAVQTPLEFEKDLPKDVNKYYEKIEKLAEGIESCWDIFSKESHNFFIDLADSFCKEYSKFQRWDALIIRAKLFWPSLKQNENLFDKYKNSFLLIPKAVSRAIKLRESKSTSQLEATAQYLLNKARVTGKQPHLSFFLRHLGRDEEEQIEKNKPAIAWAKARLDEIRSKQNGCD